MFVAGIYFPLSIQMNILTLYNNCYVILSTYMLYSALEPSYNLSKNLLLQPRILKLIEDMINYSTPLIHVLPISLLQAIFFYGNCLLPRVIAKLARICNMIMQYESIIHIPLVIK